MLCVSREAGYLVVLIDEHQGVGYIVVAEMNHRRPDPTKITTAPLLPFTFKLNTQAPSIPTQ